MIACLTILAKPSAPNGLQVTETKKDSVSLSWRIPNTDGGAPISNYIIETRAPGASSRWVRANKETVSDTNYKVAGLREGKYYDIRVGAENAAGVGPYAEIKGDGDSRATPGRLN